MFFVNREYFPSTVTASIVFVSVQRSIAASGADKGNGIGCPCINIEFGSIFLESVSQLSEVPSDSSNILPSGAIVKLYSKFLCFSMSVILVFA